MHEAQCDAEAASLHAAGGEGEQKEKMAECVMQLLFAQTLVEAGLSKLGCATAAVVDDADSTNLVPAKEEE